MKNIFLLIFVLILCGNQAQAQTTHTISMGANYANGEFYQLATDQTQSYGHSNWDIAFSVIGATDGGIFINEGSSYSSTAIKLYAVPNKTFADTIQVADLGNELKNEEKRWTEGAFNTIKTAGNFADYGWGTYNMNNHKIEGDALFVIQLRNNSYKKLMIDTLTNGTYYFRYADLDGSNLQQKSIIKNNFNNQTLAYFSFASNATVTIEPSNGWDWLFTRYETILDNNGSLMPYTVGGILTNEGVEAVMADGINPSMVDASNYTTTSDSLNIIGHEWKNYDFSQGWMVDNDRVYFVKTADSSLYKIQFIDFQGSSSGQGTFQKTYLGKWVSVDQIAKQNAYQLQVYPNPAKDYINVAYELPQATEQLQLRITNMLGQTVFERTIEGKEGLNALVINGFDLASGQYVLHIQSPKAQQSKIIQIR